MSGATDRTAEKADISCSACGGLNKAAAVFCVHCRKALGPFRYVREELSAVTTHYEKVADKVTDFIARPSFFVVHTLWLALWIAANAGIVMAVRRFDAYPYDLLSFLLGVEAIFITGFLLISQNRQQTLLEKATELDYEVNVLSYRELQETQALVRESLARLTALEARLQTEKDVKNEPGS